MRRLFAALCLAALASCGLFAQAAGSPAAASAGTAGTAGGIQPEPYKAEEFPGWARDLRRYEIVSIGAFPFAVFVTGFTFDSIRFFAGSSMGFSLSRLGKSNPFVFKDVEAYDLTYAPWPLKSASSYAMNSDEKAFTIIVAAVLALGVGTADYFIVKEKQKAALRKKAALLRLLPASSPGDSGAGGGNAEGEAAADPGSAQP